jgi:hypothetical protein
MLTRTGLHICVQRGRRLRLFVSAVITVCNALAFSLVMIVVGMLGR